jgi:hypothetical protein
MFASTFLDRYSRLSDVRLRERQRHFPSELSTLAANLSSKGSLRLVAHVLQSQLLHEREMDVRAIIAWETAVRVHRTFGSLLTPELRGDLKSLIRDRIEHDFRELSASFENTQKMAGLQRPMSLKEARDHVFAKHEAEIDIYVDSLVQLAEGTALSAPPSPIYNFYGTVGSVQTGAHSIANTVQNLGSEDRSAIAAALELVRQSLAAATSLQDRQRAELLELADEAQEQLASSSPNSTKLLTVFNVLATAVQAIPNALPAYQALKSALLPLGISLP